MIRKFLNAFVSQKDQASVASNKSPEKQLQISELRYRRLFETAQDGILILDADTGRINDANPFLKDLLGYSKDEFVGKQLWEIGVFKDIAASKKAFKELQDQGYVRYKDLPLQAKRGHTIAVEFVSNSYMVGDERVIQCNIRDISDRKKAEGAIEERTKELEDLTKSQEETKKAMLNVMEDLEQAKSVIEIEKVKDEAILASIGDGIVAIDKDGKVIVINHAGCNLLGFKKEELFGKKFIEIVDMADVNGNSVPKNQRPFEMPDKKLTTTTTTTTTTGTTFYYVRKDKTKFPIAITVTPVMVNNQIAGAIEVFRDITREIEIDKAKSEFVSIASHQLRTPLGIMKWYLEALIQEDYIKKAPVGIGKYFAEIYDNNERVLSLVRDLLSVSRIEQRRIRNIPQSVDLIDVTKKIVEQMQILAHKKSVILRLIVQVKRVPKIKIDILRFNEAIDNLIVNAIGYTNTGGSLAMQPSDDTQEDNKQNYGTDTELMHDPNIASAQQAVNQATENPYPAENYAADVARDPKNSAHYKSLYEAYQKAFPESKRSGKATLENAIVNVNKMQESAFRLMIRKSFLPNFLGAKKQLNIILKGRDSDYMW